MSGGEQTAAEAEAEAARRFAEARWPDGIRCAHCGSERVAERNRPGRRWPQWRCRDCRKEFTAVTRTALHATKRSPTACIDALEAWKARTADDESVKLFASVGRRGRPTARGGPARLSDSSRRGRLSPLGPGELALMKALRRRPSGAALPKLASLAGLSQRHSRRCLDSLARLGLCERVDAAVADGHMSITVPLWRLTYSATCMEALGEMSRLTPARPEPDADAAVPPRFWGLFWSGLTGPELQRGTHGVHIGGTLIGSRDLGAECWALRNIDTDDLVELRSMRGFDEGHNARSIDAELRRRSHAAAA